MKTTPIADAQVGQGCFRGLRADLADAKTASECLSLREEWVEVGGTTIRLLTGGSSEPLLLLHGAEGSQGWRRYAQALAEHFTVYLPSHPGFDGSQRPDWLKTMPDLVCFYTWFMEQLGLEGVRAVGFSMGS